MKTYSLGTSETSTIISSKNESIVAVAYDSAASKLYFSSPLNIYRANLDGSNQETILSTRQCKLNYDDFNWRTSKFKSQDVFYTIPDGLFFSLAFDSITRNVYVGTGQQGYILACDTVRASNFTCVTVLKNQGDVQGIFLNPAEGY